MTSTRYEVYEVSTVLGLCTTLALMKSDAAAHRVLIVSINSRHPEVESWYRESAEVQAIVKETFQRVVELNEEIFPEHPTQWKYHKGWSSQRRHWLDTLGVPRVDTIFLESIQAAPSNSLAQLFGEAEIRVYSDGLMVYSPTRVSLPTSILRRVTQVVYVDYLPDTVPLLLAEARPVYVELSLHDLKPWFARLGSSTDEGSRAKGNVVFLGQDMCSADMMALDAEVSLYSRSLIDLARAFGPERVTYKPHTSSPMTLTRMVQAAFEKATGAALETVDARVPMESLIDPASTVAVVGVFSTALFTIARFHGVPAFTVGAKDVLFGLTPFANSNRIPLVIADLALPPLSALLVAAGALADGQRPFDVARSAAADFQPDMLELRAALLIVGFHMQPKLLAEREADVRRQQSSGVVRYLDLYLRQDDPPPAPRDSGGARIRRVVVEEAVLYFGRKVLKGPKLKKLERDPVAFFGDSKNRASLLLGRAYVHLMR